MDLYESRSLDKSRCEIRVLDLQPRSLNSELSGAIRTVSRQEGCRPDYQALSYTWGSELAEREIRLNENFVLPLNDNLFNALQRLRKRFMKFTIEAEAICINQALDEEHGHQFASMDGIFSNATSVFIPRRGAHAGQVEPRSTDTACQKALSDSIRVAMDPGFISR